MLATDLKRHRAQRRAFGRHPPAIGDQKLLAGPDIDDGAMEDAAERAEQIVAIRSGRPLDRIHAEWHRRHDNADGLPPLRQRGRIEEAREHRGRLRGDIETLFESTCGIRGWGGHGTQESAPGTQHPAPNYFLRSVWAYATTAQTCSLVISSENTGIFGFARPFQIL